MRDTAIEKLIKKESHRQSSVINLIASENYPSLEVCRALGSIFTSKYAEGYPKKRYYAGNRYADELETLVQKRALKLFKLLDLPGGEWSVNVQPYSGSPANLAVYLALVPFNEKIMGLRLDMGGHLTHGHKVSISGQIWQPVFYNLDPQTEKLNYQEILKIAQKEKPKLIITGYTAYSRIIDFKKFRQIADRIKAILFVDMSHFAGLVAAEVYPSPFPYADVVMTTTHKTLRGPRAALIFSKKEFSERIDKAVFPGVQGGPHLNQIAAIAIALYEASQPSFKKYARQIVKNAQVLAKEFQKYGWRIVSGGTDSHLFLVDTMDRGLSGKTASDLLERNNIIVNKNTIPFDNRPPLDPSGIRIGTAAVTTRGMKEKQMKTIAQLIDATLLKKQSVVRIKKSVELLVKPFPLPIFKS